LSLPPFPEGSFVWCAFPQREHPARPGPGEHIAYTLGISGTADFTALVAYTSSQPWPEPTRPPGVFVFDQPAAAGLGQARAFVMDLRRLAAVPVTPAWFPRLGQPGGGVLGHMPKHRQRQYLDIAEQLLTRRPDLIERLGPLWPGQSRR
jgi:hypothetical protein